MKTLSFHALTLLLTLSLSSLFLVACGDEEEVVTTDTEGSTPEGSGPEVPSDECLTEEGSGQVSTDGSGDGSGAGPEEGSASGCEGSST
jgi:hypothetical protein